MPDSDETSDDERDDETRLEDGTYDAFVVWAERRDDGIALDLTITTGRHKGAVVMVRAHGLAREPLDLVGLPCTLVVADDRPQVVL